MEASSRATLRLELSRIARAHVQGLTDDADEEELVEAARRFLAKRKGQWLLLVDDVTENIIDLLPSEDDGQLIGHVIITAQRQHEWPQLSTCHLVDVLTTDQSMELLGTDKPGSKGVKADVLADAGINMRQYVEEELGNLAIAVALLKRALTGLDRVKAAAVMEQFRSSTVASLAGQSVERHLRGMAGTVNELIRRLREACQDDSELQADAMALLAIVAVLTPAGVPQSLFVWSDGLRIDSGYPVGSRLFEDEATFLQASDELEEMALTSTPIPPPQHHSPLTLLITHRLRIQPEDAGLLSRVGNGALCMHQLVQQCVVHHITNGVASCGLVAWGTLWRAMECRFVDIAHEHEHRGRAQELLSSAHAMLKNKILAPPAEATLRIGIGNFHYEMGGLEHWRVARAMFEWALEINEEVCGETHPLTAESLNNLATLHHKMGEYSKALPLYERALAILEEVCGKTHPLTATSLTDLGNLHREMGEYAKALPLLELGLAINEVVCGETHPQPATAWNLSGLAALHMNMGEYAKALPLLERALAIIEEVCGETHPETAKSLNNLANLHDDMGEYAKALQLCERAVEIYEEVHGETHPDTAQGLNMLAILHQNMGEYVEALPLYERALSIREEVCGETHPDTAQTLNNLAALHESMGEYAKALPLQERALAIREEVHGETHPETATSLNNLANLHNDMGEYVKALPLYERALAIEEEMCGETHPDTAGYLWNLAVFHLKTLENFTAAKAMLLRLRSPQMRLPHWLTKAMLDNAFEECCMKERAQIEALPPGQMAKGCSVRVFGLKGAAHHNGKRGEVVGELNEEKGRYPIMLQDGSSLSIKAENCLQLCQVQHRESGKVGCVVARVDASEEEAGSYEVEVHSLEAHEMWEFGNTLLPRGTVVKIHGLTSAAGKQWNGRRGTITDVDREAGRFQVHVAPGQQVALRFGRVSM